MRFLRRKEEEEINRLFVEAARIAVSQQKVIQTLKEANVDMQGALLGQQRSMLLIVQTVRVALEAGADVVDTLVEAERDLADTIAVVEEQIVISSA